MTSTGAIVWALDEFEPVDLRNRTTIYVGDNRFVTPRCGAEGCDELRMYDVDDGRIAVARALPAGMTAIHHILTRNADTWLIVGVIDTQSVFFDLNFDDGSITMPVSLGDIRTEPGGSAVVGATGILHLTTARGVAAIRQDGTIVFDLRPDNFSFIRPGASPLQLRSDGCLLWDANYAGGPDGAYRELRCIETDEGGLATGPWPQTLGGPHNANRPSSGG